MGLSKYKQKRAFDVTPEPEGGKADKGVLHFVVQKHAASHLHYDFRLEMEGVLKSWAVPKGPSTDPEVRRLAMMVEDHPYDYRRFEGIIPAGQYGGGTVIVWDEGTYESLEAKGTDKATQEKDLLHGLHAGSIKFILKGKKLKGEFALVRMKGAENNSWLMIKHKDKYASKDDITLKDRSVISRKTLDGVAKTSHNIYGRSKTEATVPPKAKKARTKKAATATAEASEKKKAAKKRSSAKVSEEGAAILKKAKAAPFPEKTSPMLATLVKEFHEKSGWSLEVKWDGYRAIALLNGADVELKSRNDKSFNEQFYPIYQSMKDWGINAIVDGEIVVLNDTGVSQFSLLQNWRSESDGPLIFYAFDITWLNGKDLTALPLSERKTLLRDVLPQDERIRFSESFDTSIEDFLEMAKKFGLEGIMAKKEDSTYEYGFRTKLWRKVKVNTMQDVLIGGFTKNEDSKKLFSSLLVGVMENGVLQYTGKIGTGFTDKMQREMMAQFKPLIIDKSPFGIAPDVNKPSRFRPNPPKASATWLKPELSCSVSYAEMTDDGVMRHPSFNGMNEAGAPKEKAKKPQPSAKEKNVLASKKIVVPPGSKDRGTLLNPNEETQVKKVNGHSLKFGNLSKLYWPEDGISKRDLLNYYYQIAPFMLPYLKDRPQSMNRYPNGIHGQSFYQKDVTGKVPEWIETMPYHSEADDRTRNYLVVNKEADLLYMASLGCIEMNPWSSTVKNPDHPDWCVIDLDPDKNSFDQVVQAARVTKDVLDSIGVPSYCKTSGSTGLHIYIPLGGRYDYEHSKEFARVIVTAVHNEIPEFTSLERMVSKRKGKMYLDFLQNRPQATLAAPYSLRPKPGATVSMPLHWEEVKKGLKMADFTIFNAVARVRETGDIFKPVLGKGIDLEKIIAKLNKGS